MNNTRRRVIAGNWKMNKLRSEAEALVKEILAQIGNKFDAADIVIFPPFTAIAKCVELVGNHSTIMIGAQNVHQEASGAFTGEISAPMLRDIFCRYVIVGHSERRQFFSESDELVNAKAKAALASKLHPIICVGERLEHRESGKMNEVVTNQIHGSLAGFDEKQLDDIIVAYEPVWAIGTGRVATPEQAQEMHELIRYQVAQMVGNTIAQRLRILYGGSVKPENSASLMKQQDVDGLLVGGASLDARSFIGIIKNGLNL